MKKLTTIILSVLLIASLFVSCDNATKSVQDELVEVTLSTQATGRSLTVSNPLEALSEVNWFYKATKVSETQFNYGAKAEETSIDLYPATGEKQKLTLSQGKWIFELFGRNSSGTLLYRGETDEVLILRSNGLNQITVEVSPYTDAFGQISFNGVKLVKANGEQFTPNYLYVTGPNGYVIPEADMSFNGTKDLTGLMAGQYTVTVAYKDTINEDNPYTEAVEPSYDVVIASETIVVTVYGGRTTTISGNISEETGSGTINGNIEIKTEATQQKTVVPNTPTTFTVNVAPTNSVSSSKVENTTVTFAENKLTGSTASLDVKVKNISSSIVDSSYTVEDGKSAVAGISLLLRVNDEPVSGEFGTAVIETYIAKGLTNVRVRYNGTDEEQLGEITTTTSSASSSCTTNYYESDTGKLVFSTTHFSEYYVVADEVVALNTTTNTAYAKFGGALRAAVPGDTIKLLKDITGDRLSVTKSLTIDGNGHTLTDDTPGGRALWIYDTDVTLTINDLTIDGAGVCERGLQVNQLTSGWNTSNVTLNHCTIKNVTHYAINLASGTTVNLEINDSYISGWAAINAYGTGNTITVNNSTLEGINSQGTGGSNNFSTVCLEGDTTGHSTLGSSDYEVTINNSTIIAKQTTGNRQSAIGFNSNSKRSSVSLNNTEIVLGDEEKCYFANDTGNYNKIFINGELIYESPVPDCWYSNGNFLNNKETGGMYTNILLPFNGGWLDDNEGIILTNDIDLDGNIDCQMTSGSFYFYLDTHSITGGSIIIKEGVSVICDKEGLSLFKPSDDSKIVTSSSNGNGTFTYSVVESTSYSATVQKNETTGLTSGDSVQKAFNLKGVDFIFGVSDSNSFADNATEMTITVTETESANAEWEVTFSDNSTKYYKIEIAGLATSGYPRWPNLYIKNATDVTRKNNASLNWFGIGKFVTISGYDYYLLRELQPNYIVIK